MALKALALEQWADRAFEQLVRVVGGTIGYES
jgi:hypothetical protein